MRPPAAAAPGARLSLARVGQLGLALALSILPLALGETWRGELGDGSRLAMAWLPWVALIGWPTRTELGRDWPLALGLALPVMALAARYDVQSGLGPGRLEATFLAGLFVCFALGEARVQAARGQLSAYAPTWFVLVAASPCLAQALRWGSGDSPGGTGLSDILERLSPIISIWRDVQPLEGDLARRGMESALFCPAILACLLLLVLCGVAARRRSI